MSHAFAPVILGRQIQTHKRKHIMTSHHTLRLYIQPLVDVDTSISYTIEGAVARHDKLWSLKGPAVHDSGCIIVAADVLHDGA